MRSLRTGLRAATSSRSGSRADRLLGADDRKRERPGRRRAVLDSRRGGAERRDGGRAEAEAEDVHAEALRYDGVVLNGYVVPGAAAEARFSSASEATRLSKGLRARPATRRGTTSSTRRCSTTAGSRGPRCCHFDGRAVRRGRARSLRIDEQCTGPPFQQPRSCHLRPLSNGAMLTVVVGQTFHNGLAPAPARTQITRTPPDVRPRPLATVVARSRPEAQGRLHLMVPVGARPSLVSRHRVPVRTYRVAEDYEAVRLVFSRGLEYWGVQQMNWADAPVLDSRSLHRVINGRGYDFYYQGPKLHMIVLREGERPYWVVNTLLNSLSNETMIAIAKGLQPLDPQKKAKGKAKAKKQNKREPDRRLRSGLCGPRHRGLLRRPRPRRRRPRRLPEKVEALRAGRVPIHEPGPPDVSSGRASASASRSTSARRSTGPSSHSSPSARRRRTPATPTSRPCGRLSTSCRPDRDDARHEEHGAARARARRCGVRSTLAGWRRRLRLQSRSSLPRAPPSTTSCIPTASSSAPSSQSSGARSGALRDPGHDDRAHGCRIGRDDQARRRTRSSPPASASSTRSRASASSSARTSSTWPPASASTIGWARTS